MQVNAMHVLIVMPVAMAVAIVSTMRMAMVMIVRMSVIVSMIVSMIVSSMVMMAKCHHSHQIHYEAECADNKKFAQSLRLSSLQQSFERLKGNLQTEQPASRVSTVPAFKLSKVPYIRRIPLANPLKVSILPNPYGNRWLRGHLLSTAANNPTSSATQSKNMWILSLRRPRESVTYP